MKLRVTSNGLPSELHITDAKTGEEIEGIVAAQWSSLPNEAARLVITLNIFEMKVEGAGIQKQSTPEF